MDSRRVLAVILSEKVYSGLFKAGTAIAIVWLIALREFVPFFYEKEMAAYKSKFEVEVLVGKGLSSVDCPSLAEGGLQCMLAKHEFELYEKSIAKYAEVIDAFYWAFSLFYSASILLFTFSLFVKP